MLKHPAICLPLALCFLASCKKEEIRTYRVAKDTTVESTSAAPVELSVSWKAPDDWKEETPGQFTTAAFTLPLGGKVTVSNLTGDGGGLAANLNRWRGQVGLKPVTEKEATGQPLKIADSDAVMQLFNLTTVDAAEDDAGILAGILPLENETWYFKLSGPVGAIRKSESAFASFLSSVRIRGEVPKATEQTESSAEKIKVIEPEGWTPSEGSAMRVASFKINGADGASADVSVIPIPGDSGSILDNVNRWRSQIQLPPLASADDPALGETRETALGKIHFCRMTSIEALQDGKKAALSAAILKRRGVTWFFKITGDAAVVEANLEKFDKFVSTADFSG